MKDEKPDKEPPSDPGGKGARNQLTPGAFPAARDLSRRFADGHASYDGGALSLWLATAS